VSGTGSASAPRGLAPDARQRGGAFRACGEQVSPRVFRCGERRGSDSPVRRSSADMPTCPHLDQGPCRKSAESPRLTFLELYIAVDYIIGDILLHSRKNRQPQALVVPREIGSVRRGAVSTTGSAARGLAPDARQREGAFRARSEQAWPRMECRGERRGSAPPVRRSPAERADLPEPVSEVCKVSSPLCLL